jgi:VanZ family protein
MIPRENPNKYWLSAQVLMKKNIPLLLYAGLIIYGSLYPFSGWRVPDASQPNMAHLWWREHLSRSDALTNFLAYIPLGYLIAKTMRMRGRTCLTLTIAVLTGTVLSASVEFLQIYLPSRVSSLTDVFFNSCGTLAGAVGVRVMGSEKVLGQRLLKWRAKYFIPGRLGDIGLCIVGLWALSQLIPLVPSLDIGNLKHGLKPLWLTLHSMSRFDIYEMLAYSLNIAAVCSLASFLTKDKEHALFMSAFFVAAVLLMKIPVIGRQLSLEAFSGLFIGLFLLVLLNRLKQSPFLAAAAILILIAFIIDELRPGVPPDSLHAMNWIPLRGQMAGVMGFAGILEGIWPFASLAYLSPLMFPKHRYQTAFLGGIFVVSITAALEWIQQFIPGRYPDITQVLLAAVGWSLPWTWLSFDDTLIDRRRFINEGE